MLKKIEKIYVLSFKIEQNFYLHPVKDCLIVLINITRQYEISKR